MTPQAASVSIRRHSRGAQRITFHGKREHHSPQGEERRAISHKPRLREISRYDKTGGQIHLPSRFYGSAALPPESRQKNGGTYIIKSELFSVFATR